MAELCAPGTAPETLRRVAAVESSFNPYAIGVVKGRLVRQPRTRAEALATARALAREGYDFSVGLLQLNQKNFGPFGLTLERAFDPCTNLRVASRILAACAKRAGTSPWPAGDALSCYYSGNFTAGYAAGYVARVLGTPAGPSVAEPAAIPVVATGRRITGSMHLLAGDTAPSSHTPPGRTTALLF